MNIIEFLEEYDIQYWESGKNISKGWIGIQCPFCEDKSNHLGIRLKDLKIKCWICGWHNIINTIIALIECDYNEAKRISKFLGAEKVNPPYLKMEESSLVKKTSLPREATSKFPKIHKDYLKNERGLKALRTIRKYKLKACWKYGDYKFRIIIPVYIKRKLVTFTSLDITGKQEPKYKHQPKKEAIIHCKKTIYNYDSISKGQDTILVEGPGDVWKMGDKTICIFGSNLIESQIKLIYEKQIRNLFLFFDSDRAGYIASRKYPNILAPLIKGKLEVITLENKNDPGELTLEEARNIKLSLGFKS